MPQGSILGPLLFLLYINDLSKIINNESVPILFVDDTSILFMHRSPICFNININKFFEISIRCFKENLLSLNFKKTQYIQCITKNNMLTCRKIRYGNKTFPNVSHTKFVSLTVDNTFFRRNRTDLLTNKISTSCYVLRSVKTYTSHSTVIMTFYTLFHSIMTCGSIFWGNSSHSQNIFKIRKMAIRIIVGCKSRGSCRNMFQNWKIYPLNHTTFFLSFYW